MHRLWLVYFNKLTDYVADKQRQIITYCSRSSFTSTLVILCGTEQIAAVLEDYPAIPLNVSVNGHERGILLFPWICGVSIMQ